MSAASPSPRISGPFDAELDLPALGAALWRKKWKVLVPTIVVALTTLLAVQVITPRYQSESRIFIESRDNIYLRPDADKVTTDPTVDDEAVTSQVQIILSRDLAREVINKLKLGTRPEFDPTLSGVSPIKAVLGLLGLVRDPLSMTPEERVLNAYYDRLTVTPVDKSRVINIDFLSQDPELAAQVANAIADGYLMRQREAKGDQAKTASQWLAGEIETMRQKVEQAETKVEDFRAKANLLVGNNNTTLSAQQLGDVNAELATARAQKADAEAKAKMIRDMLHSGGPIESSDILNSELVRRLAEQRVTLRAQLAEQSATLLDNHPRIIELKAQIADLDNQIRAEAAIIARSFENDSKLAGSRLDTLTASLDQLKNQAATTNGQDVQLRALERDAKAQRDLLESYLAKYREATSRDTIELDARGRPCDLPRNSVEYSGLSEEAADGVDRDLRDAGAQFRPGHDQGDFGRPHRTRCGARRAARRDVRRVDGQTAVDCERAATTARRARFFQQFDCERRRQPAAFRRRRRTARSVRRGAGNKYQPDRDQARASAGGRFTRGAGRACVRRYCDQGNFERTGRQWACRTRPRYGVFWQHHHQGQTFATALDLGGASVGRSDRPSCRARNCHELQRTGAQLRSRRCRCGRSRGAGDRACLRDCPARGAHHRHAGEYRHEFGPGSPPGVWI